MIDTAKLLTIFVEAGSFIAAFAAIAAGVVMASVTKKFGTGILASGFKTNAFGIFFIAAAILLDAVNAYLQLSGFGLPPLVTPILLIIKEAFFVIGTYIIVIGSKKTGDKLESLTK
jgi:hypothetical protein